MGESKELVRRNLSISDAGNDADYDEDDDIDDEDEDDAKKGDGQSPNHYFSFLHSPNSTNGGDKTKVVAAAKVMNQSGQWRKKKERTQEEMF